ncbi:glycosyl hydrolase [Aspergillus ambiguus]|uniref:glycosyl hydrolase n=1 Tax=Aspergillus ambiguus TaxID=176160 RepID=UPI003CCDD7AC
MLVSRVLQPLLAVFLAFCSCTSAYINPIIPGFNPDPSILRVGDDYWLIVSSFEFTPGIPIYHSKDLVNWKLHSHALTRPSQLTMFGTPSSLGVWASTIRYHNKRYYISSAKYDTLDSDVVDGNVFPRGFYVWTDDIASGTWSDPVYFDNPGFDQDLFWDDDGKVYLGQTRQQFAGDLVRCWSSEIDLATGRALTQSQPLVNVTVLWPEGSHVYKINGTYYLLTAAGGTNTDSHQELSYRSTVSPLGPWELNPHNPMIKNPSSSAIRRTGHADLVEDTHGNWWAVFLGVRLNNGVSQLGRETYLTPVKWEDGWPIFNNGEPVNITQPGLYNLSRPRSWADNFDFKKSHDKLDIGWYSIRTPYKKEYSLHERPGYLRIWGNAYNLTQVATPTVYLRKQVSLSTVWSTSLEFYPDKSSTTEAGAVLWISEASHQETSMRIPSSGAVRLYIRAEPTVYTLQYSVDNGKTITNATSFSNPILAGGTGRGFPSLVSADFAWARTDEI